jgi:ribosomal protein S1
MTDTTSSKKPASSHSTGSGSKTMADLMAAHTSSFKTLRKGDLVKGRITRLTKNEVAVDIEAKTEAIVLEKERSNMNAIFAAFKVGDEVEVSVLSPESESGHPVVSLRRFMGNRSWDVLEKALKAEEQLEVTITEMTKGGAVVITENGMSGFLPNSHIGGGDQQITPGKKVQVRVLDLNRKENKIVFSQKSTISAADFEAATKAFKDTKQVAVTITNITPFGMFVTVPVPGQDIQLDGLLHISELAWDKVEDINQLYTTGQKVEAIVIGFDKEARRVDFSIKRMTEDPFENTAKQYPVDSKVTGTVSKIDDNGLTLDLGNGVEGIIRKDKLPPTVTYTEGQTLQATVTEIDRRRHRISLVPVLKEKPLMYR